MSKATDDMMDTLHLLTAEKLADILRNGMETVNGAGDVVRVTAPAAYIAAAIKFLKDNNITANADSPRTGDLNNALSGLPSFDEDDHDERPVMN